MAKLKGRFIVIPKQYEEGDENGLLSDGKTEAAPIKGVSFANASKAQGFIDDMRKTFEKAYAKHSGIEGPEKLEEGATEAQKTAYSAALTEFRKTLKGTQTFIPMDVVLQTESGDMMEFESFEE